MSGPHKKGGHEEGGGHAPMWIVSFADMVILLMSFFVLLLCQAPQKSAMDENLLKILASVKVGFGYTPRPGSKDPIDLAVLQVMSQRDQKLQGRRSASRWLDPAIDGDAKKNPETWSKAQSNVWKPFRFKTNSDSMPSSSDVELEQIAETVRNHFRNIIVFGSCTKEEAARDPAGGDDLAFRRALALKNALRAHGIAASRITVVSGSCNAKLSDLKSTDRQVALVTLGEYFLPGATDTISEKVVKDSVPHKADSKPHGGH